MPHAWISSGYSSPYASRASRQSNAFFAVVPCARSKVSAVRSGGTGAVAPRIGLSLTRRLSQRGGLDWRYQSFGGCAVQQARDCCVALVAEVDREFVDI